MANDLKTFDTEIKGKVNSLSDYKDSIASTGDFAKIAGINVIVQSLRNLLLTPLGTYPFNPNYGSELYKKVFDPLDSETNEDIEFEIRDRVIEFDDRINVQSVTIVPLSDRKGVTVTVKIKKDEEEADVKVELDELVIFGLE